MKLTENGREYGNSPSDVLKKVIKRISPYHSTIEKAAHRTEFSMTATYIAAHWHQHFKEQVSDSDKILNDQVVCFFHIVQGAELGVIKIGRKGASTRIEFNKEAITNFVGNALPFSNGSSDSTKQESSTDLNENQENDETFEVSDVANINDGDVLEKQNENERKKQTCFYYTWIKYKNLGGNKRNSWLWPKGACRCSGA